MVIGIGASAGGLEACRKLVATLAADQRTAFILVQHLDPTHESLLADLLAGYTKLAVVLAEDGMAVAPGHLYVIPPGTYLATAGGRLVLSAPRARHGARMPFDFLLHPLPRRTVPGLPASCCPAPARMAAGAPAPSMPRAGW